MTNLWNIDGNTLRPLSVERLNSEDRLEDWLAQDISILNDDLLLIGRQVSTVNRGRIDLLAIEEDGSLIVIELKRDKTPRDIVAQVLDYASWIKRLDTPDVHELANKFYSNRGTSFIAEFRNKFGVVPPEPLNSSHSMIIVASALDPASQRIVEYLSEDHDVGINTAFFTIFRDGDRQYLSADWLMDQEEVSERRERKVTAPWSGLKYVNCGDGEHRSWNDMRKYSFVASGHGRQFSEQLGRLEIGDQFFAYLNGEGYVGHGEVIGEATPVDQFEIGDQPLLSLPLSRPEIGHDSSDPDLAEYAVAVKWFRTLPAEEAIKLRGMRGKVVCKLHSAELVDSLKSAFGLT